MLCGNVVRSLKPTMTWPRRSATRTSTSMIQLDSTWPTSGRPMSKRVALGVPSRNARRPRIVPEDRSSIGGDAEVWAECGGSALAPPVAAQALLLGDAGDRPVAFALHTERPNVLGRSSPGGGALDIDVARFRGSESVHRRHAQFDQRQGQWFVTHLGRNPIVFLRPAGTTVVQPGSSSPLRSGDWLQIGRIRLQLIVDPARGI